MVQTAEIAKDEVVKPEPGFLTQADIRAQGAAFYQDQTIGGEYDWIWKYQVPVNQEIILLPTHRFGVYLLRLASVLDGALAAATGGTVFTNETNEANEVTANDMTLLPATEVIDDAYYFGYRFPFSCLRLKYTTAGACTVKDLAWEYYNGTAWVALAGVTDPTDALTTAAATFEITFTSPGDWEQTAVDGVTMYWIRARCVTADYTTTPVGDQAWIGGAQELDNVDMVAIEIRNPNGWKKETIMECMYEQCKELADINKRMPLNISEPYEVRGGDWIYILVKSNGGLVDESACHFSLERERIRRTMYK